MKIEDHWPEKRRKKAKLPRGKYPFTKWFKLVRKGEVLRLEAGVDYDPNNCEPQNFKRYVRSAAAAAGLRLNCTFDGDDLIVRLRH